MGGHHGRPVLGRRRQVVGIGETADVVAHQGTLGVGGARHRGSPRIDGDGGVEARYQFADHRDHPLHLLALGHVGTRTGLDPSEIQYVGAVGHQLSGPSVKGIEFVGGPVVVEGIRGAVEDAHDEGPVGQVVAAAAEVEHGTGVEVGVEVESQGVRWRRVG